MTTMLVLFGGVLALVLINIPIAVSLGIVAVVAMVASHGTGSAAQRGARPYNGATNFPLLAIPLFILAGAIMNASGISRRLIAVASALFGSEANRPLPASSRWPGPHITAFQDGKSTLPSPHKGRT